MTSYLMSCTPTPTPFRKRVNSKRGPNSFLLEQYILADLSPLKVIPFLLSFSYLVSSFFTVLSYLGLYGSSNEETLLIDEIYDSVGDVRKQFIQIHFETDTNRKVKLQSYEYFLENQRYFPVDVATKVFRTLQKLNITLECK